MLTSEQDLDSVNQEYREGNADVCEEEGLALLVGLAELADETRSFKFWSAKGPSEIEVILEEYVDSIHFLLSLGIEKGFDGMSDWPEEEVPGDLTELFLKTTESIIHFLNELTIESYENMWIHYVGIAKILGFKYKNIIDAYILKNEENYKRQQTGY